MKEVSSRMLSGKFQRQLMLHSKFFESYDAFYRFKSDILHHSWPYTKCRTLDKTISDLEMELAAARTLQDSVLSNSPLSQNLKIPESAKKRKYLMVVGINTAFSSRRRRDSLRATWMLQGFPRLDFFLFVIVSQTSVCCVGPMKLFLFIVQFR